MYCIVWDATEGSEKGLLNTNASGLTAKDVTSSIDYITNHEIPRIGTVSDANNIPLMKRTPVNKLPVPSGRTERFVTTFDFAAGWAWE